MNMIQLFYIGTDNHIYTRWRTPGGTWTEETELYGIPKGRVAVATIPGTEIPQFFYRGTDDGIYSRWRNPNGSWSGEQRLQGRLNGNPIAAQVPGSNILQLFYRGSDNSVYSQWRNPDGSWSAEQKVGGVLNGDPIAAQVPGTQILQLFYRGTDNAIYTHWRKADGSWSAEQKVGGVLSGDPIAAQVPGTNILQLFYRGTDNGLYTRWRNPGPFGTWSGEAKMGGVLSGDPIAAQVPGTDILQLFYRGADNAIYTRWRSPGPDGTFSGQQRLGGILDGDPIAVQVPATQILQLFYRGTDNNIYSIWRNPDGTWSNEQQGGEQQIGGTLSSDPVVAEIPAPGPARFTVVLMLWGPPQPPNQTKWLSTLTGADLNRALTAIAGSTYFNRLAQYDVEQVSIWPSFPPQLSNPPWPPGNNQYTTLFNSTTDIINVITANFSSGIPSPDTFSDTIPIYIVITPRGSYATNDPTSGGDHQTSVWGPSNLIYLFAYVGAQGNLNQTLVSATHEIVEAMGKFGSAPKELCDDCNSNYPPGSVSPGIDSYTVESYFDAQANQCVAPPGFAQPA